MCILPTGLLMVVGKLNIYSPISYSYDGTAYDGLVKNRMQKGRVGLSVLYAGYYLLAALINRTFKVPNREEANILVR